MTKGKEGEPAFSIYDKIVGNLIQIKKNINTSKPYGIRASGCFCVEGEWFETRGWEARGELRPFCFEGGCMAEISPFAGGVA